jgi:regulator of protease activity HflC (stomatin/prohibitin superfamily)
MGGFKNLLQWWIILAPWEQALRVRRGKIVHQLGGGIHLRIPFFDRFFVQSVRMRISELPIQTLTTLDGHTITLSGTLRYRIENLHKLYETLHDAEGTLSHIAQGAVADYIVTHPLEDCEPHTVVEAVSVVVKAELGNFGLNDIDVRITDYARVRTYRFIAQDVWRSVGQTLNTNRSMGKGGGIGD